MKNWANESNGFFRESPANKKIKVDLDFLKNQTTWHDCDHGKWQCAMHVWHTWAELAEYIMFHV